MTDRELFMAVVSNGPLLPSDAVVVLCGEDAKPRFQAASQVLLQQGAGQVVLTGGRDEPPRWVGPEAFRPSLLGLGLADSHIHMETESKNTWQQAQNTVEIVMQQGWLRFLLVASSYHQYRAFLTFLKALQNAGIHHDICMINLPAVHVPWGEPPEGMTQQRGQLLAIELNKIEEYREKSHVASYAEGLAYLDWWEGRDPVLPAVEEKVLSPIPVTMTTPGAST